VERNQLLSNGKEPQGVEAIIIRDISRSTVAGNDKNIGTTTKWKYIRKQRGNMKG